MQSACCALPSDLQPKIQPAIATFSAGEFRRQPALSDNTKVAYDFDDREAARAPKVVCNHHKQKSFIT